MSTKHTPGPWKVSMNLIKSNYDTVAQVFTHLVQGRNEANARLIAAAPDLLQELKNIANANTVEWDDPTEFEAWAKNRARAAIAKAEAISPGLTATASAGGRQGTIPDSTPPRPGPCSY